MRIKIETLLTKVMMDECDLRFVGFYLSFMDHLRCNVNCFHVSLSTPYFLQKDIFVNHIAATKKRDSYNRFIKSLVIFYAFKVECKTCNILYKFWIRFTLIY